MRLQHRLKTANRAIVVQDVEVLIAVVDDRVEVERIAVQRSVILGNRRGWGRGAGRGCTTRQRQRQYSQARRPGSESAIHASVTYPGSGHTTTRPQAFRPPFPRPVQIAKPIQSTLPATWTEHSH